MFTTRPYNTESAADAFAESIKGCYKYIWKGCFSGKWFIRYGNKVD